MTEFNHEYKDKNGEYRRIECLTPIEFKNKFLDLELENFVTIGNMPMYNSYIGCKVYKIVDVSVKSIRGEFNIKNNEIFSNLC